MRSLQKYLVDSGTTQAALAEALGVSQPTISDWINGAMRPSVERFKRISRVTGVSVEQLVNDFDQEESTGHLPTAV